MLMTVLSIAACLAIAVGVFFWGKMASLTQGKPTPGIAKTIPTVSAKFAEEWSIVPTGNAVYEIVSSTCIRLKQR